MASTAETTNFDELRRRMVEVQLRGRGIVDPRVLDAMARVPRHEFAPMRFRGKAYEDHPLPIEEEQTISQPYIVASMLEALRLEPHHRVLEVGTGSGYATALLGELANGVISLERHAVLASAARERLERLGYGNSKVIVGDGTLGYPPLAPYNAILVSAAAAEIPAALLAQMAAGGRMIIPVATDDAQQLQLVHMRYGRPEIELRELCRFVPLVPDHRV